MSCTFRIYVREEQCCGKQETPSKKREKKRRSDEITDKTKGSELSEISSQEKACRYDVLT